jgi:hypothetical protein
VKNMIILPSKKLLGKGKTMDIRRKTCKKW